MVMMAEPLMQAIRAACTAQERALDVARVILPVAAGER
jgi:tRNA G37 N-methylase TrmD